jgi:hypothetical protein
VGSIKTRKEKKDKQRGDASRGKRKDQRTTKEENKEGTQCRQVLVGNKVGPRNRGGGRRKANSKRASIVEKRPG